MFGDGLEKDIASVAKLFHLIATPALPDAADHVEGGDAQETKGRSDAPPGESS